MMSGGSSATALAKATRLAMPPEICEGIKSRALRSPTALSFNMTKSVILASSNGVCSRKGKATFSKTLISVKSAPN